jgi:hypothetical protein
VQLHDWAGVSEFPEFEAADTSTCLSVGLGFDDEAHPMVRTAAAEKERAAILLR